MYINYSGMDTTLTISFSVLEDFLLRTTVPSSDEFLSSVVEVMMEGTGGRGAAGGGRGGTGAWACMRMEYSECMGIEI